MILQPGHSSPAILRRRPRGSQDAPCGRVLKGLDSRSGRRDLGSGQGGRRRGWRLRKGFGNPFLRLLRREVEALVKKKHGADYLKAQQAKTELARINRELKRLKTQVAALEERRSKLMADFAR